jgi:hypothetical protein
MQYKYRNYSVVHTRTFHPAKGRGNWYVGGADKLGGAGVLEWCWDKEDALQVKQNMEKDCGRFENLEVGFWGDGGQIHVGAAIE